MAQPGVDQRRQPGGRVVVVGRRSARRRGCPRSSPGSRGRRRRPASQQQRVHRRVRQQHAEVGVARARPPSASRVAGAVAPGEQHDRAPGAGEQRRLGVVDRRPARGRRRGRATITANGLSPRRLRRRSSATAAAFAGVAGQVVAAEALDGDDRAGGQQPPGPRAAPRRRGARSAPGRTSSSRGRSRGRRSAGRGSGGRPGRRTPPAQPAHIGEAGHRRRRPVVRAGRG